MNVIRQSLSSYLKSKSRRLLPIWFVVLQVPVYTFVYFGIYNGIGLYEFYTIMNGIALISNYIWVIGVISMVFVAKVPELLLKKQEYEKKYKEDMTLNRYRVYKLVAFYMYHLIMMIIVNVCIQLLISLFLSVDVVHILKLILGVLIFNSIYFLFLILIIALISMLFKWKDTKVGVFLAVLWYGWIISPLIKVFLNSNNIMVKIITSFNLATIFGSLYLKIHAELMHLPFAYSKEISEYIFGYLTLYKAVDSDYRFFIHHSVHINGIGIITLFLVIGLLNFIVYKIKIGNLVETK